MNPHWLKSPNDDYWRAQFGPYKGAVARTMFGSFSWSVSDAVQLQRASNVGTLEVAQMVAEEAAKSLTDASRKPNNDHRMTFITARFPRVLWTTEKAGLDPASSVREVQR